MMVLTVYNLEQAEQWDTIVRSFPDYDVFYLSGYAKAFMRENTDDHLEDFLRIYYSTMERTEAENEYYFTKQFYDDLNKMKDSDD